MMKWKTYEYGRKIEGGRENSCSFLELLTTFSIWLSCVYVSDKFKIMTKSNQYKNKFTVR